MAPDRQTRTQRKKVKTMREEAEFKSVPPWYGLLPNDWPSQKKTLNVNFASCTYNPRIIFLQGERRQDENIFLSKPK